MARRSDSKPLYPSILQKELRLLDIVGESAALQLRYFEQLVKAAVANDREAAWTALGILYNPPGISSGWNLKYKKIKHLISAVSEPVTMNNPTTADMRSLLRLGTGSFWSKETKRRLSILVESYHTDTFGSAHEAAVFVPILSVFITDSAEIGLKDLDLGGSLTQQQWKTLKKLISLVSDNDYQGMRRQVEKETIAAKDYARRTYSGVLEAAPRKMKPPQRKVPRRPGRPGPNKRTIDAEKKTADDWKRAKETGIRIEQFAKDQEMEVAELKALLDRVRKRRKRSDK